MAGGMKSVKTLTTKNMVTYPKSGTVLRKNDGGLFKFVRTQHCRAKSGVCAGCSGKSVILQRLFAKSLLEYKDFNNLEIEFCLLDDHFEIVTTVERVALQRSIILGEGWGEIQDIEKRS